MDDIREKGQKTLLVILLTRIDFVGQQKLRHFGQCKLIHLFSFSKNFDFQYITQVKRNVVGEEHHE